MQHTAAEQLLVISPSMSRCMEHRCRLEFPEGRLAGASAASGQAMQQLPNYGVGQGRRETQQQAASRSVHRHSHTCGTVVYSCSQVLRPAVAPIHTPLLCCAFLSMGTGPPAPVPSTRRAAACLLPLQENVNRLKAYKSNLVIFPRHRNAKKPKVGQQGSTWRVITGRQGAAGQPIRHAWQLGAWHAATKGKCSRVSASGASRLGHLWCSPPVEQQQGHVKVQRQRPGAGGTQLLQQSLSY